MKPLENNFQSIKLCVFVCIKVYVSFHANSIHNFVLNEHGILEMKNGIKFNSC